jgi:hypothetical protein
MYRPPGQSRLADVAASSRLDVTGSSLAAVDVQRPRWTVYIALSRLLLFLLVLLPACKMFTFRLGIMYISAAVERLLKNLWLLPPAKHLAIQLTLA